MKAHSKMRRAQLLIFTLFLIFAIITASPIENTRVKRQWGMGPYGGGMGMGMPYGGYGGGMPYGGYGGYGGGWGWRRPMVHRTVVVHHYHPWRS
ncbi:putative glycine-rich cell wall structural protein [Trichostrongylus colubriformis]|uniref:Glycine-rich cell wall structural protein n=1 Tax=Trichostrongylus colubriformis TaxID=6319 RepID=A0AAN8FZW6_TRICO